MGLNSPRGFALLDAHCLLYAPVLANVLTSGFSLIIWLPASDVQRTTGHWVGEFLDYPVLLTVSLLLPGATPAGSQVTDPS